MLVSLEIDPNRKDAQNANQRSSNDPQHVLKTETGRREEKNGRVDAGPGSREPGPPDGPHRRTTRGPAAASGGLQNTNAPLRDEDASERSKRVTRVCMCVCEHRPNWSKHTPADQETRFIYSRVNLISTQR